MTEKNKNLKEAILNGILNLGEKEVSQFEKIVSWSTGCADFERSLPKKEEKICAEIHKILNWHSGVIQKTDKLTGETTDFPNFELCPPEVLVREFNRLAALSANLSEMRSYWSSVSTALNINRRASKAAISVSLRQFSKDLETNIRKKLTVADCDNFGEVLSSELHKTAVYSAYVSDYLDNIVRGVGKVMEGINLRLIELRHQRKTEGA